eukprot:m.136800 g.136800  ORF g.136800 m.136800 type:complete len:120 (+) comp52478_c0_seq1:82-441(+)
MVVGLLLAAFVGLIHVYIAVLESFLFRSRGFKIFKIDRTLVDRLAPIFANQGLYNLFLAAALLVGCAHPSDVVSDALIVYGLVCVAVAGVVGYATTGFVKILYIQTVPAALALAAHYLL